MFIKIISLFSKNISKGTREEKESREVSDSIKRMPSGLKVSFQVNFNCFRLHSSDYKDPQVLSHPQDLRKGQVGH